MSPDLALQKALLSRLASASDVTDLVPVDDMVDAYGLPQRFPSIVVGEGQVVREPLTLEARHRRIYATLHVWAKTMPAARAIGGAVTASVEGAAFTLEGDHRAISTVVREARFIRDPDGETAHGIVTVDCLMEVAT
ncbi:DUF3168 domain-containing protein [Xanthobacter autotrophicus]|uniref:DUF3168 domain-containing protein n=1 Tax=Xanthobacter autotrophicus TaxID=280 RepID=UPI00372AAEB3